MLWSETDVRNIRHLNMESLRDLRTEILSESLADKIRGTFFGLALGDALGVPHECRNQRKVVYTGRLEVVPKFRTSSQWRGTRITTEVVGQYSDDTELTIASLRSLAACYQYDQDDVIRKYIAWANSAKTMGGNTRRLFKGIKTDTPRSRPVKTFNSRWARFFAGDENQVTQSNGSLMRCSLLCYLADPMVMQADCNLTNPNPVNRACSLLYARVMLMAAAGRSKKDVKAAIEAAPQCLQSVVSDVLRDCEGDSHRDVEAVGRGWVLHSLYCALWAYLRFDTYAEAVDAVIAKRGDADTNAALTGALFGARLGYSGLQREQPTAGNLKVLLNADLSKGDNPRPAEYQLGDIDELLDTLLTVVLTR